MWGSYFRISYICGNKNKYNVSCFYNNTSEFQLQSLFIYCCLQTDVLIPLG